MIADRRVETTKGNQNEEVNVVYNRGKMDGILVGRGEKPFPSNQDAMWLLCTEGAIHLAMAPIIERDETRNFPPYEL